MPECRNYIEKTVSQHFSHIILRPQKNDGPEERNERLGAFPLISLWNENYEAATRLRCSEIRCGRKIGKSDRRK
tara:strand:- start:469 stop:690 length:222 start_codon:yes stop_codon:yes gene_type:complete